MYSNKYVIGTFIALFLTLSTGFLIGSTFGDQWLLRSENNLMSALIQDVDQLHQQKMMMEGQMEFLHKINQRVAPQTQLSNVKFAIIQGDQHFDKKQGIRWVMEFYGAQFEEVPAQNDLQHLQNRLDVVFVGDPSVKDSMQMLGTSSKMIDISQIQDQLQDPDAMAHLLQYVTQILEEQEDETTRIYYYSGVQ